MEEMIIRLTKEEMKTLKAEDMTEIRNFAKYILWKRKEIQKYSESTKLAARLFSELNITNQETVIRIINALKEIE